MFISPIKMNRRNINSLVLNVLNADPKNVPVKKINVIDRDSARPNFNKDKFFIGPNGIICGVCGSFLKNKITYTAHMNKIHKK